MLLSIYRTIKNSISNVSRLTGSLHVKSYLKKSSRSWIFIALIACLVAGSVFTIFSPKEVEAADIYLFDKVITWADGSTEHVQIGDDGYFRLDGAKKKLVGIDFHPLWSYDMEGLQYYKGERLAQLDQELAYLESIGMRVVVINPRYVLDSFDLDNEAEIYAPVFDLAYEHKMLLIPHIVGKFFPEFGDLDNPDFSVSRPGDTMGAYAGRFADIAANYPNVVAVVLDNELNYILTKAEYPYLEEDQNYTPASVSNYLGFLSNIFKSRIDVPMVHNLVGRTWFSPELMAACLNSTDWPCFTVYAENTEEVNDQLSDLTTWLADGGYPASGFWVEETNKVAPIDASSFTSDFIETEFDNGASLVCLHVSNSPDDQGYSFFDNNGNPIQSLVDIGTMLPYLQEEIAQPPIVPSPSVTTLNASNITDNSVQLNGYLDDIGIYQSGNVSFEWGNASGDYTNVTSQQTVTNPGEFSSVITGLEAETTYYFRAKFENDVVVYGEEKSFTTTTGLNTITNYPENIGTESATLKGTLTDVGTSDSIAVSFIWGEDQRALSFETGQQTMNETGQFSFELTGLMPGTTYYYVAKAQDGNTVVYGEAVPLTTNYIKPLVITDVVGDITSNNATLGGRLDDLGIADYVDVSIQWGTVSGTYSNETESQEMNSEGQFTFSINGLNPGTGYFYRAKAVGEGTSYGSEMYFITDDLVQESPVVSTTTASGITVNSAILSGSLDGMGTASFVQISFEWGLTPGGYTDEIVVQIMEETGNYTKEITGLVADTTYYYRAKGAGDGINYGDEKSFNTLSDTVVIPEPPRLLPIKTSVILRWNPVSDTTNYILQVSTSPDCDRDYLFNGDVGKTTKQKIKGLVTGTTYYWRLKAGNNNGFSNWSPIWSFTIE